MNELKDLRKHNLLVFDIETSYEFQSFEDLSKEKPSLAKEFIKRFKKEIEEAVPGQYTEEYKAGIYYQEKAALYPEYGRVISCSFTTVKYDEVEGWKYFSKSFDSTDEKKLLSDINTVFSKGGWTPSGMNIGNFDIPFILKRMMVNGINPTRGLLNNVFAKPWERNTVDLSDIWAFGGYGKASLGAICGTLGVETPKGGVWGPLVPNFFWTGECPEVYDEKIFSREEALNIITEYCEKDTEATAKCLTKLNDTLFT